MTRTDIDRSGDSTYDASDGEFVNVVSLLFCCCQRV